MRAPRLLLVVFGIAVVGAACQLSSPPLAINDVRRVTGTETVTIDVLENDFSSTGHLEVIRTTDVSGGDVRVDANGNIVFTLEPAFVGDASFVYVASDGEIESQPAVVVITVTEPIAPPEPPVPPEPPDPPDPENRAPIARADAFTVAEGGRLTDSVAGNDSDPDAGDEIEFAPVTETLNGTLVFGQDGAFTYTHDGSETDRDSFEYRVSDGDAEAFAIASIEVTPVNDPPQAMDDSHVVVAGACVDGNVLENDQDPDGDRLTATVIREPAGTLEFDPNGRFSFCPQLISGALAVVWPLSDDFEYQASDGNATDDAVVSFGINVPPVGVSDVVEVVEGGEVIFDVRENDVDRNGDPLSVVDVTQPTSGTVDINSDGTLLFRHDGSENTVDRFVYVLSDGVSEPANVVVRLEIRPVNDPPVTVNDGPFNLAIGTGCVGGNVLRNDIDPDNSTLTAGFLDSTPGLGTREDGTFVYCRPANARGGVIYLRYEARDEEVDAIGVLELNLEVQVGCSPEEVQFRGFSIDDPLQYETGAPDTGEVSAVFFETDVLYFLTYTPDDLGFEEFRYKAAFDYRTANNTYRDDGVIRLDVLCIG